LADAAGALCVGDETATLQELLGPVAREPLELPSGTRRNIKRFRLDNGEQLDVERVRIEGGQQVMTLTLARPGADGTFQPYLLAVVLPDCSIAQGRRIVTDGTGRPLEVLLLDAALRPNGPGEPINPPVPTAADPGGVPIALIDSGVAYTVPAIAARLGRDASGGLLGYDYWDLDHRPYDAELGRSPFFPRRHGTAVASVLLREAPSARLITYRYPRPDLKRFAELLAHADALDVRLLGMALGSDRRADWDTFAAAAAARPHMLFVVSAGNNGRDIDRLPVYPAALDLPNLLVVTSSDAYGRLARGQPGMASGSSFAMPRVLALAAELADRHPDWAAAQLKRAVLARARRPPDDDSRRVRHGWIADADLVP
jgi:hypothetical protein